MDNVQWRERYFPRLGHQCVYLHKLFYSLSVCIYQRTRLGVEHHMKGETQSIPLSIVVLSTPITSTVTRLKLCAKLNCDGFIRNHVLYTFISNYVGKRDHQFSVHDSTRILRLNHEWPITEVGSFYPRPLFDLDSNLFIDI